MTETAASRIAFLRDRVKVAQEGPQPTTFGVPFRQDQRDFTKIEVPIAFPLYNLNSGRTHRAQTRYVEQRGLPDDFFYDPESEDAQHAQHEILLTLIDQENLAQDLLDRPQRNPIVLTYDGYIVDGNRRVAALRQQGQVENAWAVVLPSDATASEVYETELELQMARQTQARYNWIDEALHVHRGVQTLGEPLPAIAQRMNVDEKEVEKRLKLLALVDLYLEWLGAPGKYHRVGADDTRSEAAQSFEELFARESRQQFKALAELQRRAIRQACFTIIREQGGYMDIRRVADSILTHPIDFVERVKEELPEHLASRLDQPIAIESATDGGGSSILDRVAEAEGTLDAAPGGELLNIVADPTDAPQVAPKIMTVAEELTEEDREQRAQEQAARKVNRARKLLEGIQLDGQTQRLNEIARDVGAILSETERLEQQVEDLRAREE